MVIPTCVLYRHTCILVQRVTSFIVLIPLQGQMLPVLARKRLLDVRERQGGDGGLHCPGGLHDQKILCSICK